VIDSIPPHLSISMLALDVQGHDLAAAQGRGRRGAFFHPRRVVVILRRCCLARAGCLALARCALCFKLLLRPISFAFVRTSSTILLYCAACARKPQSTTSYLTVIVTLRKE